MEKWRKGSIYLLVVCVLVTPFVSLGCLKKEQKTTVAADQFLFAIVNDSGPKKEQYQVLTYVTMDDKGGLFAIIIPEDTMLEMPGVGYNRIKQAYYFKDLSLTSRSIAKFVGVRNGKGRYIATEARRIADLVDNMGGICVRQGGKAIDGNAVAEELYWSIKKRKPEAYHAIIYGIFEKLMYSNDVLDCFIAFVDGDEYKNHGTNLQREEFKKTMASIGLLKELTVVVLPGSVGEEDGISYWIPKEDILGDLRRMVTKNGLISGIRYVAEQRSELNNLRRTVTRDTMVAGERCVPEQRAEAGGSTTETVETTVTATIQVGEDTKTKELTIDVFNGGRVAGSAVSVSQRLQNKGFNARVAGNLSGYIYRGSVVLYLAGWEQEAKRVAEALGVSALKPLSGINGISSDAQVVLIVGRDIVDRK
ncbi:MAG: LCP family protein [Actinobacteria bacterium]|nr:LCP family protein [Actinomycetota bacterium]